ncbi:MAG: DMT family transporter [Planctomycetes bacterium]|nr:DMT family transporter [Planctomycetota bacterium]
METSGPRPNAALRGHVMILACAVMWSLGGVFVKVLRGSYGVEPGAIACLRSATAGLLLAWALPGLAGAAPWRAAASCLCYTVVVGSFVIAVAGTTAANAIFLQYAYPVFVAVGAIWFLGERLSRRTVAALALGLAGVAAILVCSWNPAERTGLICGFASSIAFAALALLQRATRSGSPVALSCLYNLAAAVLLLPLAWGKLRISGEAWLLVALMGAVQLGIPYVLFIRGLRDVPATDAALITLAEPILNPVWVWLAVRERPSASTLAGGALILLALAIRFLRKRA